MSDSAFDERFMEDGAFKAEPSEFLERVLGGYASMLRGGRGLDLGCGNGRNLPALLRAGMTTCGIDSSSEAVRLSSRTVPEATVFMCRAQELPFPDSSFRLVYAGTVLSCLGEGGLERALHEVSRVLESGGLFVLSDFTVDDPGATGCGIASEFAGAIRHYFDPAELGSLLRGFDIESSDVVEKLDLSHGAPHIHNMLRIVAARRLDGLSL